MANYMYILKYILDNCPNGKGECFLRAILFMNIGEHNFLDYDYVFDSKGNIIEQRKRHTSQCREQEIEHHFRIAIDSVINYFDKHNRNIKPDLMDEHIALLNKICSVLNNNEFSLVVFNQLSKEVRKLIAWEQTYIIRAILHNNKN